MEQKKIWGWHQALDVKGCNIEAVTSEENVANFARELVKEIDMIPFGEPQVVHFGEDDKQGLTLVQLISTSNICGHFIDSNGDAYLDIFSCKEFSREKVIEVVQKYFQPKSYKEHFFIRE